MAVSILQWHSPWSTPHPVVWSEPLPCIYWGEGAGTINCGCAATGAAIPEKQMYFPAQIYIML